MRLPYLVRQEERKNIMNGLNYIRKTFGMTLDDLGTKLNVKKQTINQWEKGVYKIPHKRLKELSVIFNMPEKHFGEIDDIQAIDIQNIKIEQDIENTRHERENSVYDKSTDDYITIKGTEYDKDLVGQARINNSKIKRLKVLQKIDGIISSVEYEDDENVGYSHIVQQMDSYSSLFDRFADIVDGKDDYFTIFLNQIMRAVEQSHPNKCKTSGSNRRNEIEDGNELVQALSEVIHKYKEKVDEETKRNREFFEETENGDLT